MKFYENVAISNREKIGTALSDITRFGDCLQRRIARFIVETRLNMFVGPVSKVGGSGSVQLYDQNAARAAVKRGDLDLAEAARHVRLNIAIETIDEGGQRGIEGTLVHEGKHALDFAKMLSSFSRKGSAVVFNPTAFQRELSASITSAFYLLRRGDEYTAEGLSLGLLQRRNASVSVSPVGIRKRLLESYGLSAQSQGASLNTAANPPIGAR